jgi:hypothetical protein
VNNGGLPAEAQLMRNVLVVVTAVFLFCSIMAAQNSEEGRKSLKGITGFYVSVKILDPVIEKEGLTTNQIRTDVELRLRRAGIKVFTTEQASQAPGKPLLGVDLMIGSKQGLYPYALDIGAHQLVKLERDPTVIIYATTWSVGSAGIADLSSIGASEAVIAANSEDHGQSDDYFGHPADSVQLATDQTPECKA